METKMRYKYVKYFMFPQWNEVTYKKKEKILHVISIKFYCCQYYVTFSENKTL